MDSLCSCGHFEMHLTMWDFLFRNYKHFRIKISLETIIVTLSGSFWLRIQDISINEVLFFAKSLIENQIRLFRLYPNFRIFQTFRLSDSTALIYTPKISGKIILFIMFKEIVTTKTFWKKAHGYIFVIRVFFCGIWWMDKYPVFTFNK